MDPVSVAQQDANARATSDGNVLPLNVVILTFGTRGDVQPYVRVCQELSSHGHRVRLIVPPELESWVQTEYGIETWSNGESMGQFLRWGLQKSSKKMMSFIDGGYWDLAAKQTSMFVEHWRACIDGDGAGAGPGVQGKTQSEKRPFVADAIIASPPGMSHVHIAQRLGVPLFFTHFNPKTPTREWPHGESQPSDKTFVSCDENHESWQTGDAKIWKFYYKRMVNKLRKNHLDLPKLGGGFWPAQFNDLKISTTYLYSQHVLPRPGDFPANHQLVGFTYLEPPADIKPDQALVDFLSGSGSARKVYIDFGSNEHVDKASLTATIVSAAKTNGVKAIFRRSWYVSDSATTPQDVFVTDSLPHSWLFPQVDLILHAGGAGVTALVLRNGIPSALMPFRGDQYLWSKAIETLGAAPPAVYMRDMTEAKLTTLLKEALDEKYRIAAGKVGEALRSEPDGAIKAVQMFHEHLSATSALSPRCSLLPERRAVWKVRARSGVHLSTLAAHVLDEEKLCRYGEMELLKAVDWDKHASLKPWPTTRQRKRDVVRARRVAQGVFDAKADGPLKEEILARWKALGGKTEAVNGG